MGSTILALILLIAWPAKMDITGRAISVHDGDSFKVMVDDPALCGLCHLHDRRQKHDPPAGPAAPGSDSSGVVGNALADATPECRDDHRGADRRRGGGLHRSIASATATSSQA